MRLSLTRDQKVADRVLRGFDEVQDRLESSLIGLESAESARSSITGSIEAMGLGGGHHDKMADSLARIDRAVDELHGMTMRFADEFAEVEELVSEVQRIDAAAGKVLRLAYINRLSAERIAHREDVDCSRKTVYEHLRRGLDLAYELMGGGADDSGR